MAVRADTEFEVPIRARDELSEGLKKAGAAAGEFNEKIEKGSKSLEGFSLEVLGVNQALELAHKIWEALHEPVAEAIAAYSDFDKAQTKLAGSLALQGKLVPGATAAWNEYALSITEATTLGLGEVTNLISMGQAMGMTDARVKLFIQTSANLAAMTGESVDGAFHQLANTLTGIIPRGLAQYDTRIKSLSEEQIKAGKAVEYINERLKGQAEIAAHSFEGLVTHAEHAKHAIEVEVGSLISDLFDLPGGIEKKIEIFREVKDFIHNELRPSLVEGRKAVLDFWDAFRTGIGSINFKDIAADLAILGPAIVFMASPQIVTAIGILATAFAAWSLPLISAAASMALLAGQILLVASAVDFVVRNLNNMPDLLVTIGGGFTSLFQRAEQGLMGLYKLFLKIALQIDDLGSKLPKALGGGDFEQWGDRVRQKIDNVDKGIFEMGATIRETIAATDQVAKTLDLGFVVETGKMIGKAFDDAKKKLAELQALSKNALPSKEGPKNGTAPSLVQPLSKEDQKSLEDVGKTLLEQSKELNRLGMDEADINKLNLGLQLHELDMLEKKILAQTNLDAAKKAAALEEIANAKKTASQLAGAKVKLTLIADLKEFGKQAFVGAAEALQGILSGDWLTTFADTFASIADIPNQMMKAIENIGSTISKFLTQFPAMVQRFISELPKILQKLMDALPKIVSSIADALPKIAESFAKAAPGFVRAILQALPQLITALGDAIGKIVDALPAIIEEILKALPKIITALLGAIGHIIAEFVRAIPKVIMEIFQNLPQIIQAIIEGLMSALGEIISALIDQTIDEMTSGRMLSAFLKMIPKLIEAIVMGIINGLKSIVGQIFGKNIEVPKEIKNLPGDIADGAKKLGKDIARETSNMFKVMEDNAVAAKVSGADHVIEQLQDLLAEGDARAKGWLAMLVDGWHTLWGWVMDNIITPLTDGISKVWHWVLDNIVTPITTGISTAWHWVLDNVVTPLTTIGKKAYQWVLDNVVTPLLTIGQKAWQWVLDKVVTPLKTIGSTAWQWVVDHIVTPLTTMGETIWNGFENVAGGIYEYFQNLGSKIFHGFDNVGGGIYEYFENLGSKIWSGFKSSMSSAGGSISDAFKSLYSSGGGVVYAAAGGYIGADIASARKVFTPQYFAGGGQPRGTDTVQAMLTPGEFVINRAATGPNLGALMHLNSTGALPGGGTTISVGDIQIVAKTSLTAESIRSEVVPALLKEIKARTQRGEYVVDKRGVRGG